MATLITEDCINCGACEDECPNGAISMGDGDLRHRSRISAPSASASRASRCAQPPARRTCAFRTRIESKASRPSSRVRRRSTPIKAETLSLDASTSHFRASAG